MFGPDAVTPIGPVVAVGVPKPAAGPVGPVPPVGPVGPTGPPRATFWVVAFLTVPVLVSNKSSKSSDATEVSADTALKSWAASMFVLALLFCVEFNPWEAVSVLTRLPRAVEVVVAKFASSPKAAANSFRVFSVSGAESIIAAVIVA